MPLGQFKINGFNKPFCLDLKRGCACIFFFAREDTPATLTVSGNFQ